MLAAPKAGRAPALYGAKIRGGGCGGTVCVLGLAGSAGQAAVDAVVSQYQQETGYAPFVFAGSSLGSRKWASAVTQAQGSRRCAVIACAHRVPTGTNMCQGV